MSTKRDTLLSQINAWKEGLGYADEYRKEQNEMALRIASSVMWPIIWGYQQAVQVFEDLFEESQFVSLVNFGEEDEYELHKLAEAIHELGTSADYRPEFLDEEINNIYAHAGFQGLKANTGDWVELDFHITADFGRFGYTIKFNDTKLWESGYAEMPSMTKIEELVSECLAATFKIIQTKAAEYV